jgi:uncharacterized protein YbjQ (UPF0145 family)
MTDEKYQDEKNTEEDNKKYTQDGITFKSKENWEKYISDSIVRREASDVVAERHATAALEADNIILTTENNPQDLLVEERIEIITAECVFGMNLFRDFFAGIRDVFGGRSGASQKVLRDARKACLSELKIEAHLLGANAVIGVALSYSEFSGQGKSMLFLVASGTAVKLKKE